MKMKSLKTQFIGAIAMVLVAAIAMGSSTYAWFSMNTRVTVTGMTVTTVVNDNLLIAPDTTDSTTKQENDAFVNTLTQTKTGLLEPTSTVDGKNFWYTATSNVKASGDAIADTYSSYATGKTAYTSTDPDYATYKDAFSKNYGIANPNEALGYIDYAFQLKADAKQASQIRLTGLDLVYTGTDNNGHAYRVAVFVEDITSADPAGGAGTLKQIYGDEHAAYFSELVTADTYEAVNAAAGLTTVTSYNPASDTVIDTIAATSAAPLTKYYKVVVRLWLEGEDQSCNNATYMPLTDNWALNLQFDLVPSGDTTLPAVGEISRTNVIFATP